MKIDKVFVHGEILTDMDMNNIVTAINDNDNELGNKIGATYFDGTNLR